MGKIVRIAGSLVEASGMDGHSIYELVRVGKENLLGEIIRLRNDVASIQVYEETTGLKPGEPVDGTGMPLSVELGPGVLKSIYDGVQRPLELIKEASGNFIARGITVSSIDKKKKWDFAPLKKKGDKVSQGDIIAEIPETKIIKNRVLVPYKVNGTIDWIASSGKYTVEEVICKVKDSDGKVYEIKSSHKWPIRKPRPFMKKLPPEIPLISGQRIFDTFFPLVKGGTAAIPGGFGTGKTVSQHQLAKWVDADIIVYIGCGERGNEMTEVLQEFPHLQDPVNKLPLMEKTSMIANTSNMPVAAREASVYTGMTIAEYYRDMGYDAALMADSTSRWAEAMREISSRLEEMPGEEGYPAHLASRLAEFYERAGRVETLGSGKRYGSVSVIGAVSPPGGDFSEPVTQNTLKITRVFWALDSSLADRRHFPAINWLTSYSLYKDKVSKWFEKNVSKDWMILRDDAMGILQKESELKEIVQLVGLDALPERERAVLEVARMLREDFLQQNAFHDVDTYCPLEKQYKMLSIILKFNESSQMALSKGQTISEIMKSSVIDDISKMKYMDEKAFASNYRKMEEKVEEIKGAKSQLDVR
ncbi:MAG: V-type ATP synthase subunit A [Candidatus Aenigmarchaeota archaeon]|nr:V-type ATP synthase subunit A [Candidatus Aenigmarchaeota archaeon]